MAKQHVVENLYYITHVDNIPSIFKYGILSHAQIIERQITYTAIYDSEIVGRRQNKLTPDGKSLWEYANLYFQVRNPMLYRVILERDKNNLAVLAVNPDVLNSPDVLISTGNAASAASSILPEKEGRKLLDWDVLKNEWWKEEDGSKRKIMAECLIPDSIPPHYVRTIYVATHQTAARVRSLAPSSIPVVSELRMFFQPNYSRKIADGLFLIDGDMFFSQMQTLTISVNTVGVMGKGLASRTKYQFPDVYVTYQDVCRKKFLQMGKPYLYKRESSFDTELADDVLSLPNINANKWFLLFPTKKHWRDRADIDGIEEGLIWLKNNYRSEKIESLAVPALGCGLGNLEWRDVGPLMSKYLVNLDIEVAIYLPREKMPPDAELAPRFLLGS